MNSGLAIVTIVALLGVLSSSCLGGENDEKSRAVKITEKVTETLKKGASKTSDAVEKASGGVTVVVERLVDPEPHQPGQHSLPISAGRGALNLARNITVEAVRAATAVAGKTLKFGRRAGGALRDAIHWSANRIANSTRPEQSNQEAKQEGQKSNESPSSESGQDDGDELKRTDA